MDFFLIQLYVFKIDLLSHKQRVVLPDNVCSLKCFQRRSIFRDCDVVVIYTYIHVSRKKRVVIRSFEVIV